MGTGIVSILLFDLPYNARWIYWLSVVAYCFNIALFVIFTGISVLRYSIYQGLFLAMLKHPVQSLFLGKFLCLVVMSIPLVLPRFRCLLN